MKKIKIFYWITTGIFAAFMLFSAIQEIMGSPDAVKIITGLGYPAYLVLFLGIAKLLGSITILVPGFKWLKEWAYAGFFFDLLGATYSVLVTGPFRPPILFMLLFFAFLFLSYYLWHKTMGTVEKKP
jgi:hypothetical protein